MTTETMLLVGGPCDGRRVKADGRPRIYYVPRANRIDFSISSPRHDEEARMMKEFTEEYIRVERNVYTHVSLRDKDIINLLVSGYRVEIGE